MALESSQYSLPGTLLHLVTCLVQEIRHLREIIEFYELNCIDHGEVEVEPDADQGECEHLPEEQASEMPCV
jgi:hypothetical protein